MIPAQNTSILVQTMSITSVRTVKTWLKVMVYTSAIEVVSSVVRLGSVTTIIHIAMCKSSQALL